MIPSNTLSLFPSLSPYDSRKLAVGDGHVLYLEQYGNPDGAPAVFLHGGPGSGCQSEQARLFNPKQHRIILFDQRGAGRSQPKRELTNNTILHLIADMESIRQSLAVEQWLLVGGSWGSTLAIAYAETHPHRVLGIVLRAVFLGTREEVIWAFETAAQIFYPELWQHFTSLLSPSEREDPIESYGARLSDPDPRIHLPAAQTWNKFESSLSVLDPDSLILPNRLFESSATKDNAGPNTPYVEWHYISQDCFLVPGQLLDNADNLVGIPGIIVQGRYDLLCPPKTAVQLAARWPDAELRIVPGSGHSAAEPLIRSALVAAIRDINKRVKQPTLSQ